MQTLQWSIVPLGLGLLLCIVAFLFTHYAVVVDLDQPAEAGKVIGEFKGSGFTALGVAFMLGCTVVIYGFSWKPSGLAVLSALGGLFLLWASAPSGSRGTDSRPCYCPCDGSKTLAFRRIL